MTSNKQNSNDQNKNCLTLPNIRSIKAHLNVEIPLTKMKKNFIRLSKSCDDALLSDDGSSVELTLNYSQAFQTPSTMKIKVIKAGRERQVIKVSIILLNGESLTSVKYFIAASIAFATRGMKERSLRIKKTTLQLNIFIEWCLSSICIGHGLNAYSYKPVIVSTKTDNKLEELCLFNDESSNKFTVKKLPINETKSSSIYDPYNSMIDVTYSAIYLDHIVHGLPGIMSSINLKPINIEQAYADGVISTAIFKRIKRIGVSAYLTGLSKVKIEEFLLKLDSYFYSIFNFNIYRWLGPEMEILKSVLNTSLFEIQMTYAKRRPKTEYELRFVHDFAIRKILNWAKGDDGL